MKSVTESLSCLDYYNVYLHMNLGLFVCGTHVSVCETIIAMAGHNVHGVYFESVFSPFSAICITHVCINLGTPSTGLSTEHSSPTLVLSTGSPHHSPLPANKKAIGKSTSSGDVIFKSKKRLPNLSQTSLFDSGIGSLNTSHNCCHCTPPILSKSQSCPSTPQHSVSNLSPARKHESVKQTRSLDSTPTHSAVCISPRPLSSKTHREHYPGDDSQSPAGNGVCQFCKWVNVLSRASELSAVPETEDHNSNNGSCSELHVSGSAISSQTDLRVAVLEEKVDILSEVVSRLELNDLKPSKGTQLCLPENFRSRGKSEGEKTMIKKKPGLKKAFSAEDTVSL